MSIIPQSRCLPCGPNNKNNRLNSVLNAGSVRFGVKLISQVDCGVCFGLLLPEISADVTLPSTIKDLTDGELESAARVVEVLSCGHIFHTECLRDRQMRAVDTCPLDRVNLTSADKDHIQNFNAATSDQPQRLQLLQNERQRQRMQYQRRIDEDAELARLRENVVESARLREAERALDELEYKKDQDFLDALQQMKIDIDEENARLEKRATEERDRIEREEQEEAEKRRKRYAAKRAQKARKADAAAADAAAAAAASSSSSSAAAEAPFEGALTTSMALSLRAQQRLPFTAVMPQVDRYSALWAGLMTRASAGHEMALVWTAENVGDVTFESTADETISIYAPRSGQRTQIIIITGVMMNAPLRAFVANDESDKEVKAGREDFCLILLKSIAAMARSSISVQFEADVSFDTLTELPRPVIHGLIPKRLYNDTSREKHEASILDTDDMIHQVLSNEAKFRDLVISPDSMRSFEIPIIPMDGGGWQETVFSHELSSIRDVSAISSIYPLVRLNEDEIGVTAVVLEPAYAAATAAAAQQQPPPQSTTNTGLRVELLSGAQYRIFYDHNIVFMNNELMAVINREIGVGMTLIFESRLFADTGLVRVALDFAREFCIILHSFIKIDLPTGQDDWPLDTMDDLDLPTSKKLPMPIANGFLPLALMHRDPPVVRQMRFSLLNRLIENDDMSYERAVRETCTEYGLDRPDERQVRVHWQASSSKGKATSSIWSLAYVTEDPNSPALGND